MYTKWGMKMVKEGKMKQINLKLTEKQNAQLETLSQELGGISISDLIRLAIGDLCIKYEKILK
jgi:hypothetical protein